MPRKQPDYDRSSDHDFLLENYDRLFGPLRWPKAKEVPADQFRKERMVSALLTRVECVARRMYVGSTG